MKRVLLIVFMVCFFTVPSISQTNYQRTPFNKKGRWGYVNEKGKVVIKAKYQEAGIFNSGYAIVKKDNKYGIIDYNNQEAIPLAYDYITRLDSGIYFTKLEDKCGVISADGKEIIAPKYDSIERLDSKSFLTKLEGKYGILSSNGEVLTPHKYDSIKKIVGNSNSLYITKRNNKYGLISSTYTELLSPRLLSLDLDKLRISDSFQIAKTSDGDSYIIQIQGSSVIITDVKQLNNNVRFNLFQKKELLYNDFEKSTLAGYIKWHSENTSYNCRIFDAPSFDYKPGGYPYIEVEQNDNIYTYPTVFVSKGIDDDIIFYNTKVSPNEAGNWYSTVHGAQYSTHFVTMDKIKIGKQTEDIRKCFSSLFENNRIQLIEPTGYIKIPQYPNKLLLTTNVTYADEPFVTYTPPKYIVFAGQLLEVNSGINYDVPLYNVGHLHLINTSTMNSDLITLEGISNVFMKYEPKGEYIYFMDKSVYGEENWNRGTERHMAISQNQSPIYIASIDTSSNGSLILKTAIVPKEGDVIIDIQRSVDGEYIYLCGSTTKQGYVGYENGILIILKKNNDTYEEIVRYRSKNKDRYYSKIVVLDNENICLKYDNWYNVYLNNGCNPENFDIINIPSITNREQ